MEDTQLSPDAVEALAKSLASKLATEIKAGVRLAEAVETLENNQDKILSALESVRRERLFLHYSAIICAVVALVVTALGLAGNARANQRLLAEIQQLKVDAPKLRHVPAAPSR